MNPYCLSIEKIRRFLPHRFPFLLLDRVLEIHPVLDSNPQHDLKVQNKVGTRVVAIKNISFSDPCFQGHFPDYSIFPGVLMIEALAQAACFSFYPYFEKEIDDLKQRFECILVGVDSVRLRKPVVPGDVLRLESTVAKNRGTLWGFDTFATVDGQKVAEAEILAHFHAKERHD